MQYFILLYIHIYKPSFACHDAIALLVIQPFVNHFMLNLRVFLFSSNFFVFSHLLSLPVVFLFRLFPGIVPATYPSPNILISTKDQYFKNRNGIFHEFKLKLRWEQWSNILIWQLFENLPIIKYFLAYQSIGPTIKIILSVQDNFCRTFATVRRTFGMTGVLFLHSVMFFLSSQ